MVQVPLIVDRDSGVNDLLDRDGSRTPVEFPCGLGLQKPIQAELVQAATKWKRLALKQFDCGPGEGINTDMRAVRKDYFLDHDHSAYVDQWDWERVITEDDRNLDVLTDIVKRIWKVFVGAEQHVHGLFPRLKSEKYPDLPEELTFLHAEEILERYPDLPRKQRETAILQDRGLHLRHRLGPRRRLPARDARRGLRRLDHRDHFEERQADARPQRRHPGLEPGHQTAPRTHIHGHPRQLGDPEDAARIERPARLPRPAVPPRDHE